MNTEIWQSSFKKIIFEKIKLVKKNTCRRIAKKAVNVDFSTFLLYNSVRLYMNNDKNQDKTTSLQGEFYVNK